MSDDNIYDLLSDPAYSEVDPKRVLEWDDVTEYREVMAYFHQRFGPGFRPPAFIIQADVFERLLVGNKPLFTQMAIHDFEAFETFKAAFVKDSATVQLIFSVDEPDPARKVIAFIEQHRDPNDSEHTALLEGMIEMSRKCGELHHDWVARGRPIYRINLPAQRGIAERCFAA
jgi:hypothetical protein